MAHCQYCGRGFCAQHGERMGDGEEVCARRTCQMKQADVQTHLVYRKAAQARSARGFCGVAECSAPRWGQCSRCEALFCQAHLHARDELRSRGLLATARPSSLCDHCLARRKLWSRQ